MKKSNSVMILVGLPCTGKSTFLSTLSGLTYDKAQAEDKWLVLSTDYNVELMSNASGITSYDLAWTQYIKQADSQFFLDFEWACKCGHNVIVDRTNLTIKARKRLIDMVKKSGHNTMINAKVFGLSLDPYEWLSRVDGRPEKKVPLHVLTVMAKSFQYPDKSEGFANVYEG
jgi:predicted kinase